MMPYLIIQRQEPQTIEIFQENFEFILSFTAFNIPVNLLYCDAGVLHLAKSQDKLAATLQSLPLYDIPPPYVHATSLGHYDLQADDLSIDVELVDDATMIQLMSQFSRIIEL